MPPKPKFTKEEIIETAFRIVKEHGIEALTARELGLYLGSSPRPVFTVFESMEQIRLEVRRNAQELFEKYVQGENDKLLSFRDVGFKMIQFAREEPKLYQYLFMKGNPEENNLKKIMGGFGKIAQKCIDQVGREYGLEQEKAFHMFQHMWIYTFGIGVICATGAYEFAEGELDRMMEKNFQAMLALLKSNDQVFDKCLK